MPYPPGTRLRYKRQPHITITVAGTENEPVTGYRCSDPTCQQIHKLPTETLLEVAEPLEDQHPAVGDRLQRAQTVADRLADEATESLGLDVASGLSQETLAYLRGLVAGRLKRPNADEFEFAQQAHTELLRLQGGSDAR